MPSPVSFAGFKSQHVSQGQYGVQQRQGHATNVLALPNRRPRVEPKPIAFGAEPPNYVPIENPAKPAEPSALEQLKTTVSQLSGKLNELSENYFNVLKRLALVENRTDIPKVVAKAAPATVSIFMGRSVGSGFWIKCKDGKNRIVTNAHVVLRPVIFEDDNGFRKRGLALEKNSKVVLYTQSDKDKDTIIDGVISKPLKGEDKFAVDRTYDLAVIEPNDPKFKMPAHIQPLDIADFDKAKPTIGDLVFKVGSGRGLPGTISMGIVSRLERKGPNNVPSIQTDTSINPGDSGGPLINMEGKVVGVNNSKIEDSEGIGFSIPAPFVRSLLKEWGYID